MTQPDAQDRESAHEHRDESASTPPTEAEQAAAAEVVEGEERPETAPEAAPDPSADPRGDRVAAAVTGWQRELVDLGGRNNLLWYRDLPSGTLDLSTAHPAGLARLFAGDKARLSDLVREPAAFDDACRRARLIRAKTTELREERGISTCYLAVGLATWTVPGASRPPAAPVLLRACTLRPTSPGQLDFDVMLSGEAELNPVLLHYLRSEQGLDPDVPVIEDAAYVGGSGGVFDPGPAYAELAAVCAGLPDFEVISRLVVGTFTYAKLPMVADLAAQGRSLADHDVVAALAGDPTALRAVRTTLPPSEADPEPSRELLVLDADSSQQSVIDAVRSGAHLVVHGPPGTGKSQTIANLLAVLAGEGKRVLFVAEKRAAIDAVLSRLDRVGLGDLVLDAYEGASSRRALARSFGSALDAGLEAAELVPDTTRVERTVRDLRDTLAGHTAALHEVREPWGISAYDVQQQLTSLAAKRPAPTSAVRIRGDQLATVSRERMEDLKSELTTAAANGAWASGPGAAGSDPWFGARVTSTDEAIRAQQVVGDLAGGGLRDLDDTVREVFDEVKLPVAERLSDLREVMDIVASVRGTLDTFRPEVFDRPLDDLVAATGTSAYRDQHDQRMGWLERFRLGRDARSLLRPGRPPEDLHGALVQAQEQRKAWQRIAGAGGRPSVPGDLGRAQEAYDEVQDDLRWLGGLLATTEAGGNLLDLPIAELEPRLAELAARPDRLTVLPGVTAKLDDLAEAGLGSLVADLATRSVPPEDVATELEFVWWASVLEDITVRDPRFGGHQGAQLLRVADGYAEADREHLALGPQRVRAAAGRRLREVVADHGDQESIVRAEAGKARRHKSLRELLPRAGDVLTAAKPCWAMSPLVVASLLPPGRWFDVVVFDEASQIPPAQAVSAISRAAQVVVAGDTKQLPPTTFFTTAAGEGEPGRGDQESMTEGFESILDVLTATLPTRPLTWHYRSLDERLIEFANQHVYDGSLTTFPGTGADPVVTLEPVEGSAVLTPGTEVIETTPVEVARVVDLVLSHARSRPDESLGVIALGIRHAQRLQDAVRQAVTEHPELAPWFDEDREERFFVKNLERVQGDERDAIILSVGYGKTSMGRVLYRFGPLNTEGGERRLNVAVTRARRRMTVVSALRAGDMDPEKLNAAGARMLRDFLAYAEAQTGAGRTVTPGAGRGGDRLRTDFARRLRDAGLVVHEGWGGSATPVDLAVEDPHQRGRLLLAVETDGPEYAALRAARDRDRLRPEQLARLGWAHQRVWTTDLFRDPMQQVSRILGVANRLSVRAVAAGDGAGAGAATAPPEQSLRTDQGDGPDGRAEASASVEREAEALRAALAAEAPTPEPDPTPERESLRAEPGDGTAERAKTPDHEGPDEDADADGLEPGAEPHPDDEPEGPMRRRPDTAPRVAPSRPEQTRDDTDAGWGELPDRSAHDRWLEEQRPPHWGRD